MTNTLTTFVTWLFFAAAVLHAQGVSGVGEELTLSRFHTNGLDAKGRMAWTLDGAAAEVRGSLTFIRDFQASITPEEGRPFQLSSAQCRFMHNLREVKSDSPLLVESDGLRASGIGYDIYLDRRIVRIRSAVKIVIKRGKETKSLASKLTNHAKQ